MKTYLEYKDEKSHKFWEIEVKEKTVITRYGKIGSDGRLTEKEFESVEKAQKESEKQIKSKEKKGYALLQNKSLKALKKKPFEITGDIKNNPIPREITIEEGKKECGTDYYDDWATPFYVKKVFIYDGDVYFNYQDCIDLYEKYDGKHLLIIKGNLTVEGIVDSNLRRIIVNGDLKCEELHTEYLEGEVKGDIYVKDLLLNTDSHCIFEGDGELYTPYFLSNGDDDSLMLAAPLDSISICFQESEHSYNYDYTFEDFPFPLVYEVLDDNYDFSLEQCLDWIRKGNSPIREFKSTKQEVKKEKKLKLKEKAQKGNEEVAENIKNASKVLDLWQFDLTQIPKEVFELKELESLSLGYKIEIPKEIMLLTNLKVLSIAFIKRINIDVICELKNLEELNLYNVMPSDSKRFRLPNEIGKLKKLKKLTLDIGDLGFENRSVITELDYIEELSIRSMYLDKKLFTYLPEIKKMKSLKKIITLR